MEPIARTAPFDTKPRLARAMGATRSEVGLPQPSSQKYIDASIDPQASGLPGRPPCCRVELHRRARLRASLTVDFRSHPARIDSVARPMAGGSDTLRTRQTELSTDSNPLPLRAGHSRRHFLIASTRTHRSTQPACLRCGPRKTKAEPGLERPPAELLRWWGTDSAPGWFSTELADNQ